MTAFSLSGLLAGLSSIGFGFFVLQKTQNKLLGRRWFLFTLSVAGYGFGVVWVGSTKSSAEGLLAWRVMYGLAVIWISPLFYHFICNFLDIRRFRSIMIHYLVGVVFLSITPTNLFFYKAIWAFDSFYYALGAPLYGLYFLWWMGLVIYCHTLLWRAYAKASSIKQIQIKYFFFATSIGFTGGSLSYLPSFGVLLYPWGNFGVCLYPLIMSIAIVKHRLLDIDLIIRKALLYSILSASLAAVYGGTILLIAQILGQHHAPSSVGSFALAAIFITLLFNPLRMRTQHWIDRRFPRERLDPDLLQEAAGGFAHEMRGPLSKISLPAELALMDLERAESGAASWTEVAPLLKQRLKFIMTQSIDDGYLIDAIRGLSASTKYFSSINVQSLIDQALSAQKELLEKNRVLVHIDLPTELPAIRGDAKQLEIVLINLIKNATEAMGELVADKKRELRIEGKRVSDYVTLDIRDSGPGIKPEHLATLFQPHYSTKGWQGMGIGLYLSHQIMQAHDGSITAESQEGHGASFRIKIPVPRQIS